MAGQENGNRLLQLILCIACATETAEPAPSMISEACSGEKESMTADSIAGVAPHHPDSNVVKHLEGGSLEVLLGHIEDKNTRRRVHEFLRYEFLKYEFLRHEFLWSTSTHRFTRQFLYGIRLWF